MRRIYRDADEMRALDRPNAVPTCIPTEFLRHSSLSNDTVNTKLREITILFLDRAVALLITQFKKYEINIASTEIE